MSDRPRVRRVDRRYFNGYEVRVGDGVTDTGRVSVVEIDEWPYDGLAAYSDGDECTPVPGTTVPRSAGSAGVLDLLAKIHDGTVADDA